MGIFADAERDQQRRIKNKNARDRRRQIAEFRPMAYQLIDAGVDRNGNGRRLLVVYGPRGDIIYTERVGHGEEAHRLRLRLSTTPYRKMAPCVDVAQLPSVKTTPAELRAFEDTNPRFPF